MCSGTLCSNTLCTAGSGVHVEPILAGNRQAGVHSCVCCARPARAVRAHANRCVRLSMLCVLCPCWQSTRKQVCTAVSVVHVQPMLAEHTQTGVYGCVCCAYFAHAGRAHANRYVFSCVCSARCVEQRVNRCGKSQAGLRFFVGPLFRTQGQCECVR